MQGVGWQFFLSVFIRCHYRKYFRQHYNNNEKKRKTCPRWKARNTHLRKQVVLSRIFKRMVPVDYSYQSKKKHQDPPPPPFFFFFFFYLSSNSFSSFLSQTSNLVHRSLSTWSPRFTSHDLYLRCRSLASRAKRSFYFGLPKINGSNSKWSQLWLHNLKRKKKKEKKEGKKELWTYKHHCFILSSSLLSFNGPFAPYNSTWKNVFIIC